MRQLQEDPQEREITMAKPGKMIGLGLFVLVFFILDRVLKWYFYNFDNEVLINGWFKLKMALNPGIAFGIPFNSYFIIALYSLIIFFLIWFAVKYWKEKKVFVFFFFCLIIFGAFSNLLDRLYLGKVIDYFDLKYYSVFNLADIMICIGLLGILWKEIRRR